MTKIQYAIACSLGSVSILLALINAVLITTNQATQAELRQKQGFLQQTGQLEGIYNSIATSLAQLALKDNDRAVIDMMDGLGLKVGTNASSAPNDAAAAKTR